MALHPAYSISDSRTAGQMPVFGQKLLATAKNAPFVKEDAAKTSFLQNMNEDRTSGLSRMNENAKNDLSFFDFLDVINPLQHIPIVSTIYRSITGDEIKPAARAMGGMLYGGPIGLVSGVVNGAIAEATGKDIPDTLLAMATRKNEPDNTGSEQIMLASAYKNADIAPAAGKSNNIKQHTNKANSSITPTIQNSLRSETPTKTLPYSQSIVKDMPVLAQKRAERAASGKETQVLSTAVLLKAKHMAEHQQNAGETTLQPVSLPMREAPGDKNTGHTETQKTPVFLPPELIAQEMMSALDQYRQNRINGD